MRPVCNPVSPCVQARVLKQITARQQAEEARTRQRADVRRKRKEAAAKKAAAAKKK